MGAMSRLYLDLMKLCLTDSIYIHDKLSRYQFLDPANERSRLEKAKLALARRLLPADVRLVEEARAFWFDYRNRSAEEIRKIREVGLDWPARAHTMIGLKRLDNIQYCLETILKEGVEGDVIETGVWRGGAVIFMRAILKAYNDGRTVWVADSFAGLPPSSANYPVDAQYDAYDHSPLAVSRAEVEQNFRTYGLLDEQVKFLEGWFKDTLPTAPIEKLSLCRLDGDMYESTMQALEALYHKVSPGGFVIIDDYHLESCRQAVHDFRDARAIADEIMDIDGLGAYWRKADRD